MSVSPFGYSYPPSSISSGASSQLLMSSTTASTLTTPSTSCCENGRPIMTDPHTGQSICSCQYGSGILSAYSRVPGLTDSVYSTTPYATQGYMSLGTDPSAFYSPLNPAHYDIKENPDSAWRSITQPAACYPYDPTMATYPYGNTYGGMDLNGAARRKNATRETTNTLKAWLYEHRKNPYPTKGEKIMLAIITKMTLTQVSTWFANARRRLKKENKMTWSPRNRCGDGDDENSDEKLDDDDDDDLDKEKTNDNCDDNKDMNKDVDDLKSKLDFDGKDNTFGSKTDILSLSPIVHDDTSIIPSVFPKPTNEMNKAAGIHDIDKSLGSPCSNSSDSGLSDVNSSMSINGAGIEPSDSLRPRIWSLAHVATSSTTTTSSSTTNVNKDQSQNIPLNFSKVGSSFMSSTTTTMRPWVDSAFSTLGSSIFPVTNNGYNNLSTQGDKTTSLTNSAFNGLSSAGNTSSLLRPYPPLSSLYSSPVREVSPRLPDNRIPGSLS